MSKGNTIIDSKPSEPEYEAVTTDPKLNTKLGDVKMDANPAYQAKLDSDVKMKANPAYQATS